MKKLIQLIVLLLIVQLQAQTIVGKWKTIDDKTGEVKSIVEIFESNGKFYGKIILISDATKQDTKCDKCKGADKSKPILGMQIIRGMVKSKSEYNSGKIIDPESGNVYSCVLKLLSQDKLEVRGFMGIALLGRSQTWVRVK